MIIAHAIIASGGITALVVAAAVLVVAAIALTVPRLIVHRRHSGEPLAVPVWWDEASSRTLSAASDQSVV